MISKRTKRMAAVSDGGLASLDRTTLMGADNVTPHWAVMV